MSGPRIPAPSWVCLMAYAGVLADLGADPVSYKTIQRRLALVRAGAEGYRDLIAGKCFAHAGGAGVLGLVLYNVTTLYFEAEKEDGLRKIGYSKQRRVDPQILVGLLVDRSGFRLRSAVSRQHRRAHHDTAGLSFIVGSRTVKAPTDLAFHFHWHGDHFGDGPPSPHDTRRARSTIRNCEPGRSGRPTT